MKSSIIIGSRGSKLALVQSNLVMKQLKTRFPHLDCAIKIITTSGDKILTTSLSAIGGKGLFVKEIEEALLENTIDIAVHSMKDLPAVIPHELTIGAILPRERPEDVLLTTHKISFSQLPLGSLIGTSSLRRQAQLLAKRPDLTIENLRGNVDTRIKKLHRKEYDGIVIAYAGLARLNLTHEITEILDFMIPAPCQGAIGIECRQNNPEFFSLIQSLDDKKTRIVIEAERAFLEEIGGGCQIPMGAIAKITRDTHLHIQGFVSSSDGKACITQAMQGSIKENITTGKILAQNILKSGGRDILNKITQT